MKAGYLFDFAVKQGRVLINPIQGIDVGVEDFGDLMRWITAWKDPREYIKRRKMESKRRRNGWCGNLSMLLVMEGVSCVFF